MPRDMIDNERSTAINPPRRSRKAFHCPTALACGSVFVVDQDTFLAIVRGYVAHYGLDIPDDQLRAEANEWSITRGSRSGRVAWQFVQDVAGRLGKTLT